MLARVHETRCRTSGECGAFIVGSTKRPRKRTSCLTRVLDGAVALSSLRLLLRKTRSGLNKKGGSRNTRGRQPACLCKEV